MTITVTTTSTDISLSRLIPSPSNVRRTGGGAGIESLAASIAAHGLLQSLVVRPKSGGDGQPTDRYEVVAGGRRLAALKLLAKQKRIAKGIPVPCRVLDSEGVDGHEASLAENFVRQDMHPADQFEAFQSLQQSGTGIEEIAARFGVSAPLVRQRLRLAGVSPVLIRAYRDETLTLDDLTAFAVTDDIGAQEQVFGQLQDWQRSPDTIRRLLTHALIPAADRMVRFVGLDTYLAAGGTVQRDLFSEDRGGWITDPALLERLVAARMDSEAEAIRAEGWRWVAIGPDAQAAAWRMRRVWPDEVALSTADEQRRTDLVARYDALAEAHDQSSDDLPEEAVAELASIEADLAALAARTQVWREEDVAIAGVTITLAVDGSLRVERGFVRPEDEDEAGETGTGDGTAAVPPAGNSAKAEPEIKAPALSAALVTELQAHRTAGLQATLAGQPELVLLVLLHGLVMDAFYIRYGETVARFTACVPALPVCPGLAESPARQALREIEQDWRTRLPHEPAALWGWLRDQTMGALLDLLAVCVARTADAGTRVWSGPEADQCVAAKVATAAGLDMRRYWAPTRESYLGRVPKALIVEAVQEGIGPGPAGRMAGSKKEMMVADAAQLLGGSGWLPALLRVPAGSPEDAADPGDVTEAALAMAAE
jgi:ParB family chromosome partitioning protein